MGVSEKQERRGGRPSPPKSDRKVQLARKEKRAVAISIVHPHLLLNSTLITVRPRKRLNEQTPAYS